MSLFQKTVHSWWLEEKCCGNEVVCQFVFICLFPQPDRTIPFFPAHCLMCVFGIQMPHHLHPLLFITFLCASLCHCASVGTADDLISLFNKATGNTLETDIEVTADLDFSASNHTLPLGAFSNGTCVAFSGVIHGNGHTIKGLTMNNTNNVGYKYAGLFCGLKDAIIENLLIDSSCSFIGNWAGALSVSVKGSLTVRNTTNKAVINGSYKMVASSDSCNT